MLVVRGRGDFPRFRLLISGVSGTGKTNSLVTFIYGDYDYWDEKQHSDAVSYAGSRSMVILSVPGETGYRSLPQDTEHITSYYDEVEPGVDTCSYKFSQDVIYNFSEISNEIIKGKPDVFFIDGIHALYDHLFNVITRGEYLGGDDLNFDTEKGKTVAFRAANFHDMAQRNFISYLMRFHASSIPLLGMTVWEEWKGGSGESDKSNSPDKEQKLWPALAGRMAIKMPGKFDARLSARIERRCCHTNCQYSKAGREHYVWQFIPRGDVEGIGIKGLRVTNAMMEKPWIHQSWTALNALLKRAS